MSSTFRVMRVTGVAATTVESATLFSKAAASPMILPLPNVTSFICCFLWPGPLTAFGFLVLVMLEYGFVSDATWLLISTSTSCTTLQTPDMMRNISPGSPSRRPSSAMRAPRCTNRAGEPSASARTYWGCVVRHMGRERRRAIFWNTSPSWPSARTRSNSAFSSTSRSIACSAVRVPCSMGSWCSSAFTPSDSPLLSVRLWWSRFCSHPFKTATKLLNSIPAMSVPTSFAALLKNVATWTGVRSTSNFRSALVNSSSSIRPL
mmetsp:Transcript_417/g.928  ORF Transcript_417/g.928 Transcript_417/m.928 type:complete len:262 (-) Transcript_417:1468-2253(-)